MSNEQALPLTPPGAVERFAMELSRRRLLVATGAVALSGSALRPLRVIAQGTPSAAEADRLASLLALSKTLCGGGSFSQDFGQQLLDLLDADEELSAGLDALIAQPPVDGEGTPVPFAEKDSAAAKTATAILLFWYTGYFAGSPIANRSTLAYQLTAWQAMYTPPVAVCKSFGGWANAPQDGPLQPANS